MPPAVTYALLALCGVLFLFSFAVDYSRDPKLQPVRRYSWLLTLGALAGAYGLLFPGFGHDGRAALRESQAEHQPLFLEFFAKT